MKELIMLFILCLAVWCFLQGVVVWGFGIAVQSWGGIAFGYIGAIICLAIIKVMEST